MIRSSCIRPACRLEGLIVLKMMYFNAGYIQKTMDSCLRRNDNGVVLICLVAKILSFRTCCTERDALWRGIHI